MIKVETIPSNCPDCNGVIIWENTIFKCENHFITDKCNGFFGRKDGFVQVNIQDNLIVVFNLDVGTTDVCVDGIKYHVMNGIDEDLEYQQVNKEYAVKLLKEHLFAYEANLSILKKFLLSENKITN